MAQYLDLADKLFWNRKERFNERFLDDLIALVTTVIAEIINKHEKVIILTCFYKTLTKSFVILFIVIIDILITIFGML